MKIPVSHKDKEFSAFVGRKEKLKLKASREKHNVWAGLGSMGLIGWSVAIPAVCGAATGMWFDRHYPQHFSWTLSGVVSGIVTGVIIAWGWVGKENKAINHHKEESDE